MSLSKIYKLDKNVLRKSEIYHTKPGSGDPNDDSFLSLDSLWQSTDTEYVDTVNRLKEEQEKVERQTREMLETAKAQVAKIETEAYDKGFKAGKEEALAVEQKKQLEMQAQFDKLVVDFNKDRERLHEHYELDILSLVKLMVERVLFHEVTVNPLVIETCLKTAMSYVVQNSKVKINLHRDDMEIIQQVTMEKPQLLNRVSQIELTEDPAISRGGCYLETGFGEIDATLETRRDKIYKALDVIFVKALAGRDARDAAAAEKSSREEQERTLPGEQKNEVDEPLETPEKPVVSLEPVAEEVTEEIAESNFEESDISESEASPEDEL